MRAEIISIGTEILLGQITDTDSSYLASQLPYLGIDLYWISQVGDNPARLVEVLRRAWERSELILTTGGLGPTEDDLTREAIAEMLNETIETDPGLENTLRKRFAQLHMDMPLRNLKQATIIPSAQAISNERGTAPGWWVERDGHILIAMPGPPVELQYMWQKMIQPRLQRGSDSIIVSRTLKTFGLSEAAVDEMVSPLLSSTNPTLAIYAKADGIHLRLTAKMENQGQAEKMIRQGEVKVRNILDKYIWGTDDDTLEIMVGRMLVEKELSLAVMEDYSGGRLASAITDMPESTAFFRGGLVACSDEAKIAGGVPADTIAKYEEVSSEVAGAMAQAIRRQFKADIGIAVSGMQEIEARPMGVVYIGITDGRNSRVVSRTRERRRIIAAALVELRNLLISAGGV